MFKTTAFVLATAAAASMLAVPLSSQEIVVSARSSQAFVEDVSSDLNSQLRRMRFDTNWNPTGIVKVRFHAGEDGSPTQIVTYESSGRSRLDREVKRAVSRIDSLDPLPAAFGPDPVIQANVIVANSPKQREKLERKLEASEAARMASGDPAERAVLALTMTPRPRS